MQIANVQVALGGDQDNRVPKYGVTAAEIVVLRAIHGTESVIEIEPAGEVKRSHQLERSRLVEVYGGAKDEDNRPHVINAFPGAGVRLPENIGELGLPDEFFRATVRAHAGSVPTTNAMQQAKDASLPSAALESAGEDPFSDIETDDPAEPAGEPNTFE